MMVYRRIALACLVCFLVSALALSQDLDSIQLETTRIAENVAVISGGGGNIGVLTGPDGVLLVDTQMREFEEKVRAAVAGVSDQPVRLVVNTHWHFDHTGCNGAFADLGALIVAADGTRDRLASAQEFPLLGIQSDAAPPDALPTIEVSNRATLFFDGEEIELVHVEAAHSGHDLVVHLKSSNVIHAGDLYWSRGYPYIGTPHGGSLHGLIEAAEMMLEMANDATKIIPGHGPVTGREGLEAYRDMLVDVRNNVAQMVAEGLSVEEIVAAQPTASTDEERKMGMPPEVFVRLVHRDVLRIE